MNARSWKYIVVTIDSTLQDLIIGQLGLLGFQGFFQDDHTLGCVLPAKKWTQEFRSNFQSLLTRFKKEFPRADLSFTVKLLHEQNWNKSWESKTGIIEATPHIIIKPSWKTLPKRHRNKIVIHIDPKMSFGTGHHETTRLSLTLLEKFLKPDMKVLDFGCGTGILGIASVKLGAGSVVAVDNDPWAFNNSRENILRNRVRHSMKILLGSISVIPRIQFDLIIANIDFPTISKFIKPISQRIHKKGIIIFSGILDSDLPRLLPLFEQHSLALLTRDKESEWTAIALQRKELCD